MSNLSLPASDGTLLPKAAWVRFGTILLAAACLLAGTMAMPVSAQTGSEIGVWDYYVAGSSPDASRALLNLEANHIGPGIERMARRDYVGAVADFTFILKAFPNHPRVLSMLSEVCDVKWKGPRCDMEGWLQRALDINPSASQTHVIYGLHFQRLGRRGDAIASYERAIELNPRSQNAHYNLALIYIDQKQFDLANLHAQAAYALGHPLPGLRDMLTKAGRWKVLPADEVQRAISPTDNATKAKP